MKIKLLPRPDNEHRTQEEAIALHNQRKERMISMPDIFQTVQENNAEAIESLRKDFKDHWLVTSTRIIYNQNDLSARIIHNADSTITKQKEIAVKEIPVCQPTYLPKLLDNKSGLDYFRALVDAPKATKEQLLHFFIALSGKKEDDIRFWTPSQSSRRDDQARSVQLYFYDVGWFCVFGGGRVDDSDGLSRGVVVGSAKQTKFFSNKAIFDIEEKLITIPMQRKIRKDIERKLSSSRKVKITWNLKVKIA